MTTSRRAVLTTLAAAAVAAPLLTDLAGGGSRAAAATGEGPDSGDKYPSNTALYQSGVYLEGQHWVRRFGRAEPFDNYRDVTPVLPLTAVIAPHGGAIEPGTSELCMTIAGYAMAQAVVRDPAKPAAGLTPLGGGIPARDFWMFEALVSAPNNEMHVTSTHCDDPIALSVVGGARYAVSLHGFDPFDGAAHSTPLRKVVIGGGDARLKQNLYGALTAAFTDAARPVVVEIAGGSSAINGDDPANIVNRTYGGGGAQLELSTDLRSAMFATFGSAGGRRDTAGQGTDQGYYWNGFVNAVRTAVDAQERGLT